MRAPLVFLILLFATPTLAKKPVATTTPACIDKNQRGFMVVSAALDPDGKRAGFCLRAEERPPSCWQVDLDTGAYVAVPTMVKGEHLKQYVRDPAMPSLEAVPGGVRVCRPGAPPSECRTVTAVHEESLWRTVVNRAGTLLAIGKGDLITTYDVDSGSVLARIESDGLVSLLDDTVLVVGYCAGPCGATLYDARTGKELGDMGGGNTTASYGIDAARVRGSIWATWEYGSMGRAQEDDFSLVLHDASTGALVRRMKLSALKIKVDSEIALLSLPGPAGGLVVIPGSPTAGDVVVLDGTTFEVRKHLTPPPCKAK
jgi:hypothetical protein